MKRNGQIDSMTALLGVVTLVVALAGLYFLGWIWTLLLVGVIGTIFVWMQTEDWRATIVVFGATVLITALVYGIDACIIPTVGCYL